MSSGQWAIFIVIVMVIGIVIVIVIAIVIVICTFFMDLNDFIQLWDQLGGNLRPFGDLKTAIGSKKALESAIGSRSSTKNEARDGYIGNLRHHKAFESAKYNKTIGKTMKTMPREFRDMVQGGVKGGSGEGSGGGSRGVQGGRKPHRDASRASTYNNI